jgi:hypothetical protein
MSRTIPFRWSPSDGIGGLVSPLVPLRGSVEGRVDIRTRRRTAPPEPGGFCELNDVALVGSEVTLTDDVVFTMQDEPG